MKSIQNKTNTKWFDVLDKNYENIKSIVYSFTKTEDYNQFIKAYEEEDKSKLDLIMNEAWFNAPDRMSTRSIPGFMIMCGLLDGSYEE